MTTANEEMSSLALKQTQNPKKKTNIHETIGTIGRIGITVSYCVLMYVQVLYKHPV